MISTKWAVPTVRIRHWRWSRLAISSCILSPAAPVGQYGWDGGLGTIWRNDPSERMITALMTNAAWSSPRPPAIASDFLTAAYACIDD